MLHLCSLMFHRYFSPSYTDPEGADDEGGDVSGTGRPGGAGTAGQGAQGTSESLDQPRRVVWPGGTPQPRPNSPSESRLTLTSRTQSIMEGLLGL